MSCTAQFRCCALTLSQLRRRISSAKSGQLQGPWAWIPTPAVRVFFLSWLTFRFREAVYATNRKFTLSQMKTNGVRVGSAKAVATPSAPSSSSAPPTASTTPKAVQCPPHNPPSHNTAPQHPQPPPPLPAPTAVVAPPALTVPPPVAQPPPTSVWAMARRVFRGWVGTKERADLAENSKDFVKGRHTDNGSKFVREQHVARTGEEKQRIVRRSIRLEKNREEALAKAQMLLEGKE
jgi:hypothetical protein